MNPPGPHVVSYGSAEDLGRFYPPAADRAGVEGEVVVKVTLDEAGRLTDTRVLSESPAGMGFAAAAAHLAQTFSYANPTRHPTAFEFKVKFDPRGSPPRADQ